MAAGARRNASRDGCRGRGDDGGAYRDGSCVGRDNSFANRDDGSANRDGGKAGEAGKTANRDGSCTSRDRSRVPRDGLAARLPAIAQSVTNPRFGDQELGAGGVGLRLLNQLLLLRNSFHFTIYFTCVGSRSRLQIVLAIDDPFTTPLPDEVPLPRAPLLSVIAQVRFPLVASVERREFIAPFQEAIRDTYPVLRQEQTQALIMTPAGPAPIVPQATWRFTDLDQKWRVSLTPGFLALETEAYTSRTDFLRRLDDVVKALDQHIAPKLVDRLGLRFVDRVTGGAVDEITKLVRPEVSGIVGALPAGRMQHTITESVLTPEGARLLARWGILPPNQTVDPSVIEPLPERTWILDLDMSSAQPFPFSPSRIAADAKRFAEQIYAFFRWVVTDDFLLHYGGKP
jgi:uncharacterized protein (TIGR04255 family)